MAAGTPPLQKRWLPVPDLSIFKRIQQPYIQPAPTFKCALIERKKSSVASILVIQKACTSNRTSPTT
eukprot:scaffold99098_cov55-Attheya_sp.AAC.3